MKLVIFHEFNAELESFWYKLMPRSQYHVFQSYKWLECWQQTVGSKALFMQPWIAVILDINDGQPMMIFPLGIRRSMGSRVLEFLGGAQADYNGPLICDAWIMDKEKLASGWGKIESELPGHDVCHFKKLPAKWRNSDNALLKIWKTADGDSSYSTSLPDRYVDYLSRQRKKFRQDSRRQRKRLSELGDILFEVVRPGDLGWKMSITKMFEQKSSRCRTMKVPDIFENSHTRQFYQQVPGILDGMASIHFSVLKVDDEILATHWGAIHKNRYYYLMPTITDNELRVYSPGRLLLEHLVEQCIQDGIKVFDFTIGGEDYKRDWCDSEMQLFEHLRLVGLRGLPYYIYIQIRQGARKNKLIWSMAKTIYSVIRYGRIRS